MKPLWGLWAYLFVWVAGPVAAYDHEQRPVHHLFNARLLAPGESEIAALGNCRYGLTEQLEVGTNAWWLLGGGFNLSLKHDMFKDGAAQTSFVSHSFWLRSKEAKALGVLAPVGVITSYSLPESHVLLNGGLFDLVGWLTLQDKTSLELHIISPMFGVDWEINQQWALSSYLFLPLYGSLEGYTEFVDISVQALMYEGQMLTRSYPFLGFLGLSYDWGLFSLEAGAFNLGGRRMPILNGVWRFR